MWLRAARETSGGVAGLTGRGRAPLSRVRWVLLLAGLMVTPSKGSSPESPDPNREPGGESVRSVEVRSPARLHLGMLSFGDPAIRSFGGVGLMVERPGVWLRMQSAAELSARGPLAERAVGFAAACRKHWGLSETEACEIEVVEAPREHVGLGSGTQLALAVAAGLWQLHVRNAGEVGEEHLFEREEAFDFARATGRGRRSCVGLHGFSRGGLVIEGGRHTDSKTEAGGDPAGAATSFSPMVARVRLPSQWRCLVLTQRDASGLSGEQEQQVFAGLPPVAREVTGELARIATLELVPAAVEGDFDEFADAVFRYGRLAGRPFESAALQQPHAESIADTITLLGELGVRGAAQSSWGPTIFACCRSLEQAAGVLERFEDLGIAAHFDATITRFDNDGASLRLLS